VIRERFATTAAAVPAVLRASDADAASTASVSEGAQAASLYSSFSSETSVSVYESRLRGVCVIVGLPSASYEARRPKNCVAVVTSYPCPLNSETL
jgi:hypothetical protein